MVQKRRKLSVRKISKLVIVIILIIIIIVGIKTITYKNSDKYKLKEIGYNDKQIEQIFKFDKNYRDKILNVDYDEFIIDLFSEEYFKIDKFDRYMNYHLDHKETNAKNVVAIVNVNADKEHYTDTIETDTSKDLLMLVNKYNYLPKNYEPDDIEKVKNWYAYGNNELREEVYEKFIEMFNAAKKEDLTIIINSSYRPYDVQEELYEEYVDDMGEEEANKVAAKPGFSEHQTGLTIDVSAYTQPMENFENTDEFKWMEKNAHKYGFILRYPEGKELITGYDYESWHYRYVGIDVATKIKELGITFDEYYEYYIK